MPNSEECHEATQQVRNWYLTKLKTQHPTWPKESLQQVFSLTSYQVMLDTYCKETGAYRGPYSPLG